jgi:pimeloyl-ACP methyl ester carboxylesterase
VEDGKNFHIDNGEDLMIAFARLVFINVLNEHRHDNLKIWLAGFSLGAFMATQMAVFSKSVNDNVRVEHLILVSPFASCMSTVAPCCMSHVLFHSFDCFDNKRIITNVNCDKVTFIHGTIDDIVKPYNSKYLLWTLKNRVPKIKTQEVWVKEKGHNDLVVGTHACLSLSKIFYDVIITQGI